MLKHIGGFLVGVLVGVLVIAVALVGGGYLLLTQEGTMKKVEDGIGSSIGMDLSEEQEKLSILEYGQEFLSIFGALSDTPIAEIESTIGINKISTTISDAIGIDTATIGESTIKNLGTTITDNLNLNIMRDKFEMSLPDLPLFQDEEFLDKPVSDAFGSIDENNLDGFIVVVYDDEATEDNPASSAFMQKLGQKTIKEVSENMDGIIQDTAIGEIVKIDESSSQVMKYLEHTKVGNLDGAIKDMQISDAINITDASSRVLIYLRDRVNKDENGEPILDEEGNPILGTKLDDLDTAIKEMKISDAVEIILDDEATEEKPASSKVLQYFKKQGTTLDGLNAAINAMPLSEAIKIEEDSHAVLKAIGSYSLTDLGNKETFNGIINGLVLGDIVPVDDSSAAILKSLQFTEIGQLGTKMNDLCLNEVIDDCDSGVLSLLDPTTKINEIGPALGDAVTDTSLYALRAAGVFNYDLNLDTTKAAIIERINKNNATPKNIVGNFTAAAGSLSQAVSKTIFLANGDIATNVNLLATAQAIPGSYTKLVDITSIATQNSSNAYVLTPAVIDALFADVTDLSDKNNVVLYVDDNIDIEIGGAYNKLFSIIYDLDSATNNASLYIGSGTSFISNIGGAAVYASKNVKVQNEDVYVDYVDETTTPLNIAVKEVSKIVDGVKTTEKNTWLEVIKAFVA